MERGDVVKIVSKPEAGLLRVWRVEAKRLHLCTQQAWALYQANGTEPPSQPYRKTAVVAVAE